MTTSKSHKKQPGAAPQPKSLAGSKGSSTFLGRLDHPVLVLLSAKQKGAIVKAAQQRGQPLAGFMREAALERAEGVLKAAKG